MRSVFNYTPPHAAPAFIAITEDRGEFTISLRPLTTNGAREPISRLQLGAGEIDALCRAWLTRFSKP